MVTATEPPVLLLYLCPDLCPCLGRVSDQPTLTWRQHQRAAMACGPGLVDRDRDHDHDHDHLQSVVVMCSAALVRLISVP